MADTALYEGGERIFLERHRENPALIFYGRYKDDVLMITDDEQPDMIQEFRNNDKPFVVKAKIIVNGINHANVLSCSTKIFFTAGSKSQAILDVLPATRIERASAKNILLRCFTIYSLYSLLSINFNSSNFIFINLLTKCPRIRLSLRDYLI